MWQIMAGHEIESEFWLFIDHSVGSQDQTQGYLFFFFCNQLCPLLWTVVLCLDKTLISRSFLLLPRKSVCKNFFFLIHCNVMIGIAENKAVYSNTATIRFMCFCSWLLSHHVDCSENLQANLTFGLGCLGGPFSWMFVRMVGGSGFSHSLSMGSFLPCEHQQCLFCWQIPGQVLSLHHAVLSYWYDGTDRQWRTDCHC